MMDALLEEVIKREGVKDTDDPNDSGGRTKFGISQKYHPEAWVDGPPSKDEAKRIFFNEYIIGTNIYKVQPEYLLHQLADMAVLHGPPTAIMKLQAILKVEVDGRLGPLSLEAISKFKAVRLNNLLVDSRVRLMARIVQRRPKDLQWLFGWIERALSFRREE